MDKDLTIKLAIFIGSLFFLVSVLYKAADFSNVKPAEIKIYQDSISLDTLIVKDTLILKED
jgi:hypothetical protein